MTDFQAFLLSWEFDPTIIIGLAVAAGLYIRGWRRLRRRGRGGLILKTWRAWCFGAGLAAVALALLSPIGTFDSLFFSFHMTQHILLIMVAAPLIWLGAPLIPTMWAFNHDARRRLGRLFHDRNPVHKVFHFLTKAGVALPIFVLTLFVWHIPTLYDAAQGKNWIHDLEHFMFFGSSLLLWWPVIHPSGARRRLGYGAAILYIFPAKIAGFVLGAALTLSAEPFYRTFLNSPSLWGLTPLGDQQLGGLIMWVAGGLLYIVPLLILVLMMMHEDEGHVWVPETVRAREAAAAARAAGEASPPAALSVPRGSAG